LYGATGTDKVYRNKSVVYQCQCDDGHQENDNLVKMDNISSTAALEHEPQFSE
jgi:hypothetical protein